HRDDSSAPYAKSGKIHWLGDLQIDPHDRDVAMFTTGYGLYRTTNLTAAEPNWTFFNEGFEQSAIIEFASPPKGPVNLFSAIGDRDGYRHDDFDVSPVLGVHGQNNGMSRGTSDDIDVAWNDPNTLVRISRIRPFVQFSRDNGVTWAWMNEQTNVGGGVGGNLALSNDGTRVLYAPAPGGRGGADGGAGDGVLYATREGDKWSAWQTPTGDRPTGRGTRVVVDLGAGDTFYAITGRRVARSTDGGKTWATASDNVLPQGVEFVRSVPGKTGHLIASAGERGVFRSTDGGKTWTRLAPDKVTAANHVGVGAAGPGRSYPSIFVSGSANGTTGYFRSDDEGKTWTTISDAQHQFGYPIVIQGDARVHGRLYVGTNGRGILVGDRVNAAAR
ncbi:MAG TPA: sialidase family protein, partial [Tepidisphaeraceae bacterium]